MDDVPRGLEIYLRAAVELQHVWVVSQRFFAAFVAGTENPERVAGAAETQLVVVLELAALLALGWPKGHAVEFCNNVFVGGDFGCLFPNAHSNF